MSSTGTLPSEVAPWIERLARLGYAAKALLYGTIGLLAANAANAGLDGSLSDVLDDEPAPNEMSCAS